MNESRGGCFFFSFLSRPSKEFLVRMFGSPSCQTGFFPPFLALARQVHLHPSTVKARGEGGVGRGYLCTGSASRLLNINPEFELVSSAPRKPFHKHISRPRRGWKRVFASACCERRGMARGASERENRSGDVWQPRRGLRRGVRGGNGRGFWGGC